jgi:hypothetical protein
MGLNAWIDSTVKCTACGSAGVGNCDCWQKCKHGYRHESKCTVCTYLCSCKWYTQNGVPCGNPQTHACSSRVRWGKYNRKTKAYEQKTPMDRYKEYVKAGNAVTKAIEAGKDSRAIRQLRQYEEVCRMAWVEVEPNVVIAR